MVSFTFLLLLFAAGGNITIMVKSVWRPKKKGKMTERSFLPARKTVKVGVGTL